MKTKPNTEQFKLKKDPSDFLEGGLADQAEKSQQSAVASTPSINAADGDTKLRREQKVFRLPLDLINALKRESYEKSVKTGSRVTETELVEKALREFLKILI